MEAGHRSRRSRFQAGPQTELRGSGGGEDFAAALTRMETLRRDDQEHRGAVVPAQSVMGVTAMDGPAKGAAAAVLGSRRRACAAA